MNIPSGKIRTLLGIAAGAAAGYAWYHFVGCTGGTCPITSNPINSTAYGALMGALLFAGRNKNKKNTTNEKHQDHS